MKIWLLILTAVSSVLISAEGIDEVELPIAPLERPNNFGSVRYLVNPLNGQISCKERDLVIKGAENIVLDRSYFSPSVRDRYHSSNVIDTQMRSYDLAKSYIGWKIHPQLVLQKLKWYWLVPDENGSILAFTKNEGVLVLENSEVGVSNWGGENPGACFDPRNIRIEDINNNIHVFYPSGLTRIYKKYTNSKFLLWKELLPNGKVLLYNYNGDCLVGIEACDCNERFVYAKLGVEISNLTSSYYSNDKKLSAFYRFEKEIIKAKGKYKGDVIEEYFTSPKVLKTVSSPGSGVLNFDYTDKLLIDHCERSIEPFKCHYKTVKRADGKQYLQLEKLVLPSGEEHFKYEPPEPELRGGSTIVCHADDTKSIYYYNKNLLLADESLYDEFGDIKKQTKYEWDEENRLSSIKICNSCGAQIYERTFDYDEFGNPIVDSTSGGITVFREYSQDGMNLLLYEKIGVQEQLFSYYPGTNLISTKRTKENGVEILLEQWSYDDSLNLIEESTQDKVSCRIKKYKLRQSAPFLHMPAEVEFWCLENHIEKFLKRISYEYDDYGNINREDYYNSDGSYLYSIRKVFNDRGDLVSEVNALGEKHSFDYDERGLCVKEIDFAGTEYHYLYDQSGNRVQKKIIPCIGDERIWEYKYDALGRKVQEKDYTGIITNFKYDLISSRVKQKMISTQKKSITTSAEYDCFGHQTIFIDERGFKTEVENNLHGLPLKKVYPDGTVESFTYDSNGFSISKTTSEGTVTQYDRDIFGRATRICVFSSNGVLLADESYTYSAHYLLNHKDREGVITEYFYDGYGRKIREERAGRIKLFKYDCFDRIISKVEGEVVSCYKYDALDRLIKAKILNLSGDLLKKISYEYDKAGNCVLTQKNGSDFYRQVYDGYKRLISYEEPNGATTSYIYDDKMRCCTKIDPRGLKTVTNYDALQNPISITIFDKDEQPVQVQEYEFDLSGNLELSKNISLVDGQMVSCRKLSFTYSSKNELLTETREGVKTTSYCYTPTGKLKAKIFPDGTILSFKYSELGDLLCRKSNDGTIHDSYVYNSIGLPVKAHNHITNEVVTRDYDAFGNMIRESSSEGVSLSKTYDDLNRPLSIVFFDGKISFDYDGCYLKSVSRFSPSGEFKYAHEYLNYTLDGNILEEKLPVDSIVRHDYALTGQKSSVTSQYYNELCEYDLSGKRVSSQKGLDIDRFSYDGFGQLVQDRNNIYHYDGHFNRNGKNEDILKVNEFDEYFELYEYDHRDNLYKNDTFRYDCLNRLIEADGIKFQYDSFDRKVVRFTPEKEIALFDNENEFALYSNEGNLFQLRIPGLQTVKCENLAAAFELEGKPYSPIYDCSGNVVRLIDIQCNEVKHAYSYSPFGEITSIQEASFNPWRYAGKRYEPKLHLVDFGKRHYDPALGRWLSPDPAGYVDSFNLYQYCFNDPFSYHDPDGEFAFLIAIPLSEIILGAAVAETLFAAVALSATTYAFYEGIQYVDNWLNQSRRGLPLTGAPNSSDSIDWGSGRGTIRDYDEEGKAETDYDFGHDHNGSGDPHAHDWDWSNSNNNTPPQRPSGRPLRPGE